MSSEELREQNKLRLIDAAAALFLVQGIQQTSMGQVAQECGLTRRTAVNIFGTKDNLTQLAVSKIIKETISNDEIVFHSKEFLSQNGLNRIVFLLKHRAQILFNRPIMVLLLSEMEVYLSMNHIPFDLAAWSAKNFTLVNATMLESLKQGIEDSSIRNDVDLEKAMQLLTGTYMGLLQRLSIFCNNAQGQALQDAEKEIQVFIDTAVYYLTQYPLVMRNLKSHKMLIIDDIEVNRFALSAMFQEEYHIATACNGKEGLDYLQQNPDVALVILDLMMPEMDGFTFLEIVRKDKKYEDVAIIVNTTYGEEENERRALTLGADEFISKPYHSDIVKYRIRNLLLKFDKIIECKQYAKQWMKQ